MLGYQSNGDELLHKLELHLQEPKNNVRFSEKACLDLGHCTQCGKLSIYLSLKFYVKSILEDVKVQKMPFLQFKGSEMMVLVHFSLQKMQNITENHNSEALNV